MGGSGVAPFWPTCVNVDRCISLSVPIFVIFKMRIVRAPWGCHGDSVVNNPPANAGDAGLIPGLERSPGEGSGSPLPVFFRGESHGQRSLAGYSPWGRQESDTT